jgi:hypothetical protein
LSWVPKGAASAVPRAAPVSEEELAAMRKEAQEVAADVMNADEEDSDDEGWETEEDDEEMDEEQAIAKAKAVAAALAAGSSAGGGAGGKVSELHRLAGASQQQALLHSYLRTSVEVSRLCTAAAAPLHCCAALLHYCTLPPLTTTPPLNPPHHQPAPGDIASALAALDMDHYDSSDDDDGGGGGDDEDDDGDEDGGGGRASAVVARALGGRVAEGIVLDDPYLQRDDDDEEGGDDDDLASMSGSEREDYVIRPDDLLILAASNEDDLSTLGVWVYEEAGPSTGAWAVFLCAVSVLCRCLVGRLRLRCGSGWQPTFTHSAHTTLPPKQTKPGGEANIYPHHDLLLPAFPLCMAWLDLDPSGRRQSANMVAIGSMEPGIEIWDLDVLDQVEPAAALGGVDAAAVASLSRDEKRKLKKKAAKKVKKGGSAAAALGALRPGSHAGAVLGLSWNQQYRNVLASGSADGTVKIWDVAEGKCEHTLTHHAGSKVQAVAWNPAEAPVLLTGAFDRTAALVDARAPAAAAVVFGVSADVEALAWAPHEPTCFLVSSEDGLVAAFDARGGAGELLFPGGVGAHCCFLGEGANGDGGKRVGVLSPTRPPKARHQTILAPAPPGARLMDCRRSTRTVYQPLGPVDARPPGLNARATFS